mgnify:CR=1 FL=1
MIAGLGMLKYTSRLILSTFAKECDQPQLSGPI